MEKKTFQFTLKQMNDSEDSKFYMLEGIASDNSPDRIDDIVVAGAVVESVKKFGIPKFLHQHDMREPIGVFKEIVQVGKDTMIKAELPKGFEDIDKIVGLVKMGAYGGFSIGFNIIDSEWKDEVRIIKEIEVLEISLVTIPCNSNAIITSAKSNNEGSKMEFDKIEKLSELEDYLKQKEISNNESKGLIGAVKRLLKSDIEREAQEQKDAENQREVEESKNALTSLSKSFETYKNKITEA